MGGSTCSKQFLSLSLGRRGREREGEGEKGREGEGEGGKGRRGREGEQITAMINLETHWKEARYMLSMGCHLCIDGVY